MIPKNIYFCNKTITEKDIEFSNKWKILNPEYEIQLYDDEMCRAFLLEEYGESHKAIFDFLKDGPIKADFFRICILYKKGGIYSDIDSLPLIPLSEFLEDVDFITCSSYANFKYNPNFICSYENNIILKKCIDWYVNKSKDNYSYWDWSIMNALSQTLELENYKKKWGIYKCDSMNVQIIQEIESGHWDDHNIYNDKRVFNNRQPGWNPHTHTFNI
jgi:mannosyltransferase OCH1-like enzyme